MFTHAPPPPPPFVGHPGEGELPLTPVIPAKAGIHSAFARLSRSG